LDEFLKLREIGLTHLGKGKGDYILGTKFMYEMLSEFNKAIEEDRVFEIDADLILKRL